MRIREFLSSSQVVLDVRGTDKAGVLNELAMRAASALGLGADMVAREIRKREELGSTGIGHGIALPHARVQELKKPFGVFARCRQPIEFNAIDGQPVDLVFLILLPAAPGPDQLNPLAAAARRLRRPEVVARLRAATTITEVVRDLIESD
jgi:PTS system nitrogen regulatory IIA component